MDIILTGKFLIRRAKSKHGKGCLVITGIAIPNIPLDSINPNDEMWSTNMIVSGGNRYFGKDVNSFSPEDFLDGMYLMPSHWEQSEPL